ncbi:hypothetical protein KUD11_13960 [Roseovarius sp. LXJ103]|nr:hypothetical protein [Roseovarius carneus]PWE34648.1 hypothetical protein DD563_00785 [Pelagicola sp. LXJ1103]
MSNGIAHALNLGFTRLELDASIDAHAAMKLYDGLGFATASELPTGSQSRRLVRVMA